MPCPVLDSSAQERQTDILETDQQRATKMTKGMEHEKHPRKLGLFSLEKRELRGILYQVHKHLKGEYLKDRDRLF